MSRKLVITACALAVSGLALAKLPPQDDAAKAKAAEASARAAWQARIDAYQLCKVQDRVAAQYRAKAGMVRTSASPSAGNTNGSPSGTVGAAGSSATAAPSSAQAAAAITAAAQQAGASPAAGATPAAPAGTATPPQSAGAGPAGGTPVAAAPTLPSCADPGPFAFNPPAQTPLEASGAHSPAGNAAAPPSVRPESAQMAPAGAATPQSKKP